MNRLGFLSVDRSQAAPAFRCSSPVRQALAGASPARVRELPQLSVLELRGRLEAAVAGAGETLVRLTPARAVMLIDGPAAAAQARLDASGVRAYDLSAGHVAFEVDGVDLLRRLTDLDLDQLPAIGPLARGTPVLVQRIAGETFRLVVAQELGRHVAEVICDTVVELDR